MIKQSLVAMFLVSTLAACGGSPKKKTNDSLIEADQASESCCCRIEGDDPDDPTFSRVAVMECSSRHGTCIKSEAQCEGQAEPDTSSPPPDDGSLPPAVDTPNSF